MTKKRRPLLSSLALAPVHSYTFLGFVVLLFVIGSASVYFGEFLLLYLNSNSSSNLEELEGKKPALMIVDMCSGNCGLGNQMFRYAAGLGIAMKNPNYTACVFGLNEVDHLAHSHSSFTLHVFPSWRMLSQCPSAVSVPTLPYFRKEVHFLPKRMDLFEPPHSIYQEFRLEGKRPVWVNGCMQSFKYFQHLPHPFFKLRGRHVAREWLASVGATSVVHVRRGDKVQDGSPVAPISHYEKALELVGTRRVAVVTDDPEWVMKQEVFHDSVLSPFSDGDADPGLDMAILAAATDAVIIGIGTFGWWGAYLSRARHKYFYPTMYNGKDVLGYNESDYIPYGVQGQGQWIPVV